MIYLGEKEFEKRKAEMLDDYWRWLGGCALKFKGQGFLALPNCKLKEFGHPIPWAKIINGAVVEIFDELRNPIIAINKFLNVLKIKLHEINKG